jgi:hypothetical protein
MENLINFFDFGTSSPRGRRLPENHVSVWYNLKGNKSYGCTFSNNIKTDKKYIKIGKLGDDICFMFTNEPSIRIYGDAEKRKNVVFNSKGFVEHIFPELKSGRFEEKNRKIFKLKVINPDIFVITGESKH